MVREMRRPAAEQLIFEMDQLQNCISEGSAETPMAVLTDCYSEEFTGYAMKTVNSRATDLQGQVARLTAEAALARKRARTFQEKVRQLNDQIDVLDQKLKRVREEKDSVARMIETTTTDVESTCDELEKIKLENSDIVRSQ